jgi:hypothetical protein
MRITLRSHMRASVVAAVLAIAVAVCAAHADSAVEVSYSAGVHDAAGVFMGGTELRTFVVHGGKLYAGNGYWEDRPGEEGRQGAEILVLDAPNAGWRVEHGFDEWISHARRRDLAISALATIAFETDGAGARLREPVSMLVASAWDLTGATQVFSRDDATGAWTAVTLAEDQPRPDFLPQIRSFGWHRDRATGVDRVFAGQDPRGIFSGVYDPAAPGRIRWGTGPELDIATISTEGFPGLAGRLRVSGFAEANGALYAAVGQQIYERGDGTEARWHLVYTNPRLRKSETGLRGLTAIHNPSGPGEVLLAAVEGDGSRIVRIDPRDGRDATDLDLDAFLDRAWGTRVSYVIAAYNEMTRVPDAQGGEALVMGIEAFIPKSAPQPAGHIVVDGLETGAWYLLRHPDGKYELREIAQRHPATGAPLVAVRVIAASPFPGDDALFFGGFDANKRPAHNTAWVLRADRAVVFDGR